MNRRLRNCLGFWVWISFGLLSAPAAFATVTCSVTVSSFSFGDVDPQSSQTDVTGTLNYTCTTNRSEEGVNLCFSLGEPGGASIYPRKMRDSGANPLNFQLYTDPARTLVWGSQFSAGDPYVVQFLIQKTTPKTGSVPIYGRVIANQASAIPGNYKSTYVAGGDTRFTIKASLGSSFPSGCSGGTNEFNFGTLVVSANVAKKCTVTASPLSFGAQAGLLDSAVTATTTLGVQCSRTTAYNVGLDAGQNSGGDINARQMVLGSGNVGYQLYRDAARSIVWGNTEGSDTAVGVGTGMGAGTTQTMTVYGTVPAQPTPPAGTYQDTVVVTVTY